MITRIAPTPSGYLHAGNAANAVLAHRLARREGGRLLLRIDDVDAARARPEYVDDVFGLLDWLGIAWDLGPRDAADFAARWSQALRTPRYRSALSRAAAGTTYACSCSRRALSGPATGGCPGRCRERGLPLVPGTTALRVVVPEGTTVTVADGPVGGGTVRLDHAMGDFVVWRRDDLPAYQLASVVDDVDHGVSHVVRGRDLRESTAAQRFLADLLGLAAFTRVTVIHHDLVTGPHGGKLSKSQAVRGVPLPRTASTRELVTGLADRLGAPWGLTG